MQRPIRRVHVEATLLLRGEDQLELYVDGLREDGHPLDFGVVRRKFPLPA